MTQATLNFDAPRFDGSTYDHNRDGERLTGQLQRVFAAMSDGNWRTLAELSGLAGGTEAAVSARLRDLRKERFGGHTVEREYVADGLWRYRLIMKAERVTA
jgi:hypothetical protein